MKKLFGQKVMFARNLLVISLILIPFSLACDELIRESISEPQLVAKLEGKLNFYHYFALQAIGLGLFLVSNKNLEQDRKGEEKKNVI